MTMKSFTYRFITLISLLFTICYTANGQYKDITIEKSSHLQLKIVQIDFREFSTFIHFEWIEDLEERNVGICAGENFYIQDNSNYKKYKLLNSINLPLCPTKHAIGNKGEKHNFTLEFAKVPSEIKLFDIIGKGGKNGFCFFNVKINRNKLESFIDITSFTEQTPVKEYGTYYKDGSAIQYVKHKGLIVSAQATWSRNHGRYVQIDISIQNLTGRDQLFNPNAITATFQIGEEVVDHEVLSHEKYMKKVEKNQFWQGIALAAIEGAAAGLAGHSSSTTSYSSTSSGSASGYVGDNYSHIYGSSTTYGTSYSSSYNGAAAYAAQQNANRNVEEFTDKQYQIKHQLSQGYAKLHTINNETEYLGYVNIKAKKSDMKAEKIRVEVTIPLNNTNFIFFW